MTNPEVPMSAINTMPGRPWLKAALLCTAQFIDVLGVTILIVALPTLQRSLNFTQAELGWLASVYALFFGGFLLASGRAADLYGPKRIFMAGLALFTAASLLSGIVGSFGLLLTARALQGLGAALQVPAALSLLTETFPDGPRRTRALAVWTAAAAAGGATGLALGGLITEGLGWRWIFLLNVPLGVLSLLLAPRLLQESRLERKAQHLDGWGALLGTGGILALAAGFTAAQERGLLSTTTLLALGLAGVLLIAFVIAERRAAQPLLPFHLVRRGALPKASLVAFTLTATTSSAGVINTLYLQRVLGFTPTLTGIFLMITSLTVIVGSALGSRLSEAFGFVRAMAFGLVSITLGLVLYTFASDSSGLPYVILGLGLSGLGLGCASVASTAAALSGVEAENQGVVSGFVNTAAQLGTALGVVVFVGIAAARTRALRTSLPAQQALLAGYHWAYLAAALMALAALLYVVLVRRDMAAA